MNQLIQRLRRAALVRDDSGLTDGVLLTWFVERRDEAAFEALLRRHGPMVLGVCRRVLRDPHDAEDAFQATFLVLVRKAASVVPADRVGAWLYGVARTTALRAKAAIGKRRRREQPVPDVPEARATAPDPWDDLAPVLDEELRGLPEKYRLPIVLCDLEGRTHKDAARHAGWPVGTLSGRLSRARSLLARRLARRGVALSGAALGVLLGRNAPAGVPAAVSSSTVQSARLFAAGRALTAGVAPARVAALTQGVLTTMFVARLKAALGPVFLAACLALPVAPVATYGQKEPPAASGPAAAAVDPKQIILRSAEACRGVRAIEYVEEQTRVDVPQQPPRSVATIRQARADVPDAGFLPGKFAVEGSVIEPGREPRWFAFAYDGATLRVLDPAEKAVAVLRAPDARRAARLFSADGMTGLPQFSQDRPFQTLLDRAVGWEYRGTRDVKGTVCDVVALTLAAVEGDPKGQMTTLWFIGRDDHLPRGNEVGTVRKLVTIRAVNDRVAAREYGVATPAGYTDTLVTGDEGQARGLLPVGSPAPDWTLSDPQGRAHALKDCRGKVVVLDFWGTWCIPCRKSMPALQAIHDAYKDRGVLVFGVAVGDKEGDPAGYVKRQGYTYPLLLQGDDVAAQYKAVTLPTLYVIGADGKVVHAEYGTRETLKTDLASLLDKTLKAAGK